jgi:hypothetical protein
MSEPSEKYSLPAKFLRPKLVIVDFNLIKNLKEWNITSTILNIISATFLGGTFLGQNLLFILGPAGGIMIAVGVLIEEKKFGGLIKSVEEKGIPTEILYMHQNDQESATDRNLEEKEASAQV